MAFHVPEESRITQGHLGSNASYGNNGAFRLETEFAKLLCIASDGDGWEHVSVSPLGQGIPTWMEMCAVKDAFWDEEDCVVQFHPPKSQYVNFHPRCLHLWRKIGTEYETPPTYMIGPRNG